MPVKSKKQLKFMYAVKAGKVKGVPKSVGKKFIKATSKTKRSKLMKGGKKKK